MFDRFTDRAKKVLNLARQEVQRLNHEHLGTEHILLGLVEEGGGVAANVFKNRGVDLTKIRAEVNRIVKPGPPTGVVLQQLPFTPRAKKVLELTMEEASNLGQNYIGTEHLLLGLIKENEGIAAQVLLNLNLKLEDVREEVLDFLGVDTQGDEDEGRPQTSDAAKRAARAEELFAELCEALESSHPGFPTAIDASVLLNAPVEVFARLEHELRRDTEFRSMLAALGVPSDLTELSAEIDRLERQKDAFVAQQDFEAAARSRDSAYSLGRARGEISSKWRSDVNADPVRSQIHKRVQLRFEQLVGALIAGTSGLSSYAALLDSRCELLRSSSAETFRVAERDKLELLVQRGKSTIVVADPGSGRRRMVTSLSEKLADTENERPIKRLILPNFASMSSNDDPWEISEQMQELAIALSSTSATALVLFEFHILLDSRGEALFRASKHFLEQLLVKRFPVIATTTPAALAEMQQRLPGLMDRFEQMPLATADQAMVSSIIERAMATISARRAVDFDDGTAEAVWEHRERWSCTPAMADPGRCLDLLRALVAFGQATSAAARIPIEAQSRQATYKQRLQAALRAEDFASVRLWLAKLEKLHRECGSSDAACDRTQINRLTVRELFNGDGN